MNVVSPPAAMRGITEEEWQVRCDLAAPAPAKGDSDKKPGDKKPAKEFIYQ